jgi:hypothetical protein
MVAADARAHAPKRNIGTKKTARFLMAFIMLVELVRESWRETEKMQGEMFPMSCDFQKETSVCEQKETSA